MHTDFEFLKVQFDTAFPGTVSLKYSILDLNFLREAPFSMRTVYHNLESISFHELMFEC